MLSRTLCPVLVDRAEEMSALRDALREARGGDGRLVVVSGDAGIGKSRLVREVCNEAEAGRMAVLRGSCSEADLQVPYLPFIEAIRNHLRRTPTDALPADLNALFGRPAEESIDPTRQRLLIFEATARFLEDVAGVDGAVLCVEDVHWSDAGTRDLLDFVTRTLPRNRLLVITTYRAEETGRGHPLLPLLRGWVQRDLAVSLQLRPLGREGIAAMLEATIGTHEAALAERLHRRSDGNPFVLEEILKTGVVGLTESTLPDSVRDAILRRVERLETSQLDVLRAAAVLGDPIDDGILIDLLGDEVPDALEACVDQQLLTRRPDGGYGWRHALTREAVYQDIAPARRRRLHAEVADACDRHRPPIQDLVICGHLAAAERWDAAVPRYRRAAAAAVAVGAFADAARSLEACVPHLETRPERAELLEEIAGLQVQSGVPDAGERSAREALEVRLRLGDPSMTAVARRTLALSLWQQARWAEAIDQERRAIADLELGGPTTMLVAALARLGGWTMLGSGDVTAAIGLIDRARHLAEMAGLDARLYRADEGQVLVANGRIDAGLAILDEAWRDGLRGTDSGGPGWREAKFMVHHAVAIRNLLGRTHDSLATLAETRTFRTTQDVADTSLAVVEAEASWAHGETTRARAVLETLDLGRLERVLVPWAQCVRADLLWSAGDRTAAAMLARTAMPGHWQPISQLRVAGLIHILVDAGDLASALELVDRLDRLRGYSVDLRLGFIDAATEASSAAGRLDVVAALVSEVRESRPDDPRRLRIEARSLLASGAYAEAALSLRAAAAGFATTAHRQDEWRTRRLLVRALHGLGQHREAQDAVRALHEDIARADGTDLVVSARSGLVLSRREREVAILVAQGLRNREIAERLFITERTVENHIHRVLQRAGLRSRAELTARMVTLSGELSGSLG